MTNTSILSDDEKRDFCNVCDKCEAKTQDCKYIKQFEYAVNNINKNSWV